RLEPHRRDAKRAQELRDVARAVVVLSAAILRLQVGLLAVRGREREGHALALQLEEPREKAVHRLVAVEYRAAIGGELLARRLDLEAPGVHLPPVAVLVMRRAVGEERREIRLM